VLVFYVSVLPQFMSAGSGPVEGLTLAYAHAIVSLVWLLALVAALHRAATWLHRRPVRRSLDALTGSALVGFGVALGVEDV
jgi:threonine/homoserine/homoserine lactone efflux protein